MQGAKASDSRGRAEGSTWAANGRPLARARSLLPSAPRGSNEVVHCSKRYDPLTDAPSVVEHAVPPRDPRPSPRPAGKARAHLGQRWQWRQRLRRCRGQSSLEQGREQRHGRDAAPGESFEFFLWARKR